MLRGKSKKKNKSRKRKNKIDKINKANKFKVKQKVRKILRIAQRTKLATRKSIVSDFESAKLKSEEKIVTTTQANSQWKALFVAKLSMRPQRVLFSFLRQKRYQAEEEGECIYKNNY